MKFTLTIEMGNAAFEEDPIAEVARILEHVANAQVPLAGALEVLLGARGPVRDANGNTVGEWRFEP